MITAVTCLAMAIYFEARDQPIAGQLAVAQVVLNRVLDKRHPDTVCKVIMEGPVHASGHPVRNMCQFSFWCDGKPERPRNKEAWRTAVMIATAVTGPDAYIIDVSEGATFYHSTKVSPAWKYTMHATVEIGQHVFYKTER